MKNEIESIANQILLDFGNKPDYSNRDFLNTIIIFQSALMDKMFELQDKEEMTLDDRCKMAESCGESLKKLIHTYTGLNTHDAESF